MKQAKAIAAGIIGAATFFSAALADGLTANEIVGTLVAGVVAWQAVYWAPRNQE